MKLEEKYQALIDENNQLKKQLDDYGKLLLQNNLLSEAPDVNSKSVTNKQEILKKRLEIYQSLFRGRDDVYALRWAKDDKASYSPAKNPQGEFAPLTKEVLFSHLSGKLTVIRSACPKINSNIHHYSRNMHFKLAFLC